MSERLHPDLWQDLPTTPWAVHGRWPGPVDCYGPVLEIYRRMGIALPDPPYAAEEDYAATVQAQLGAWEEIPFPEPGCCVLGTWPDPAYGNLPHVGVYLGEDRWIHATRAAGVVVTPLSAAQMAQRVRSFHRYRGASVPVERLPEPSPFDLTVVEVEPISGERTVRRIPWQDGLQEADFTGPYIRRLAGEARPGGVLVLSKGAGSLPPLAMLAIGLALSLVGALIQYLFAPTLPKPSDRTEPNTPTFDLTGFLRNTAGVGYPQPVVYGEHRTGGHILSAFQRADEQGRSHLWMLVFLSRGPIESVAGLTVASDGLRGSQIPAAIEIDGNPASTYDCEVFCRLGTSDQEPIPGLRETVTAAAYQVILLQNAPFTHVGTVQMESFEINVSFPLGLYNINTQNGNVTPRTVTFTIGYRIAGSGAAFTTNTWAVTDARRGTFARTYRKDGLVRNVYEIQITRTDPAWPETQTDHESRSDLIEVHEISPDALSYPGKALMAMRLVASEQVSGIPTFTATIKGRKVFVWDGVSVVNPAFGSGEVWSDNPAWCAMDMAINQNYGLGRNGRFTLDNIDLASFLAWASNCNTLVDDGRGGTTKRATFNYVADSAKSGWELMNAVALSSWARLVFVGRKVKAVVETTATPVYAFNMGNVSDVQMTYLGKSSTPNMIEVQYFNGETNYEADQAQKLDATGIFTNGDQLVKEELQAVGVTRAAQAYRLAQFRLNFALYSKRRLTFTAGPESLHLLPGDAFWWSHDAMLYGLSGRVLSATSTTVRLDQAISIPSGTNKITVRTKGTGADVLQERTLTNGTYARDAAITVTSAWDVGDVPVVGDVYAAGVDQQYRYKYRILSLDIDADLKRRISAYQDADAIYSDDPGPVETFTDIMPDPRATPAAVNNLSVVEVHHQNADGGRVDAIVVQWDTDARWESADVWYQSRQDTIPNIMWQYAGRSNSGKLQIDNVPGGSNYLISVCPVSRSGFSRTPHWGSQQTIHVRGWRRRPTAPSALSAHIVNGQLVLSITPPSDAAEVIGYQVRYGGTWGASFKIGDRVAKDYSIPAPFTGTQTVRVRSVNRHGAVSASEVTASVTFQLPGVTYGKTTDSSEEPAWGGTKTGTVVDGTALKLDAFSGTYAVGKAASGTKRGVVSTVGSLQNVQRTWDDCGLRWDECTSTWDAFYLDGFEVSEGLTWDECGFPWDSLPGTCLTWDGPIDIHEALTPTMSVNDGAASFNYSPFERSITTTLTPTVTMRTPHRNYVPQLTAMNTALYDPASGVTSDFYPAALGHGGI